MRITKYAVVPAVALALAACGGGGEKTYDVAGEVISKQTEEECDTGRHNNHTTVSCETEYEIFLDTEEDDVDVTEKHYGRCEVGDRFPACTGNGQ